MRFIANCSIPASVNVNGMEKPVAQIAFAVPAGDAVYSQHHDFEACVLGPLQHGSVEAAILVKIKLIDLRSIVRLAQLLKAHRTKRRDAEHRSEFRGCSRDGTFTLVVEETLQGGRRAIDRQRKLLAQDGDGEIDVFYAAQDVGHEVAGLEGLRVAPVGHLVVRRAVDVIEYRSGQPSFGQTAEIMKVMTVMQMHARSQPVQVRDAVPNQRLCCYCLSRGSRERGRPWRCANLSSRGISPRSAPSSGSSCAQPRRNRTRSCASSVPTSSGSNPMSPITRRSAFISPRTRTSSASTPRSVVFRRRRLPRFAR